MDIIAYWILGVGGAWMVNDGVISIIVYLGRPSWVKGKKQNWRNDHFVRGFRILWGLIFIISGWVLLNVSN